MINQLNRKFYPPMLVTTSLFDNRVLYSEPVKYIAKLILIICSNILEV